jgi:hypothetical protein
LDLPTIAYTANETRQWPFWRIALNIRRLMGGQLSPMCRNLDDLLRATHRLSWVDEFATECARVAPQFKSQDSTVGRKKLRLLCQGTLTLEAVVNYVDNYGLVFLDKAADPKRKIRALFNRFYLSEDMYNELLEMQAMVKEIPVVMDAEKFNCLTLGERCDKVLQRLPLFRGQQDIKLRVQLAKEYGDQFREIFADKKNAEYLKNTLSEMISLKNMGQLRLQTLRLRNRATDAEFKKEIHDVVDILPVIKYINEDVNPRVWHGILAEFQDKQNWTDSQFIDLLVRHLRATVKVYHNKIISTILRNTWTVFDIPAILNAQLTPLQRDIAQTRLSRFPEDAVVSICTSMGIIDQLYTLASQGEFKQMQQTIVNAISLHFPRRRPHHFFVEQQPEDIHDCCICLERIIPQERCLAICGGANRCHRPCILPWIQTNRTCPTCRTPMHLNGV